MAIAPTTTTHAHRAHLTIAARDAHRALIRLAELELNGAAHDAKTHAAEIAWHALATLEQTTAELKRALDAAYVAPTVH